MLSMKDVAEKVHFKTSAQQSMWSTGSALNINETWTLFSQPFPAPGLSALDGDLTADMSGSFTLALDVVADSGGISLDFPLKVSFSAPSHVAAGQQFTVQTTNNGLDSSSPHFKAEFPHLHVDVNAIFQIDIGATFNSDIVPGTPVSFGTSYDVTQHLLHINSGFSKSVDNHLFKFTVPSHYDNSLTQETIIAGDGVAENVRLDVTTQNIADVNVDLISLLEDIIGPEFPDLAGSELGGILTYDLLDASLVVGVAITQQFQFVPVQINVELTTPWGASTTVALGSAVTFQAPADWTGDSTITASYSLFGNLISQSGFVGNASLDLTAISGGVTDIGSFGPLYQNTFPLYTTAPLYIYNPGGSGGFSLEGLSSVTHEVKIAHGDGKFTGPGGVAISGAQLFTANDAVLMQSVMNGSSGMTGTNVYNPAAGSGDATAEANMLDVAMFTTSNANESMPSSFEVGFVAASGVQLYGAPGTLLLAAAPGVGGTATLTGTGNELMVAGQEGDVTFNISSSFQGTLAGLNAGDQIVPLFAATIVSLQNSQLVFSTLNLVEAELGNDVYDPVFWLNLSGDYSDINFELIGNRVVLTSTDSNVVGNTAVALQGSSTSTWSQETNLGDLAADSMSSGLTNASGSSGQASFMTADETSSSGRLSAPAVASPTPVVSLRTASTIRTGISGTANPETGKPAGGISQYDIEHALPSDYKLMVFDTTAAGLKQILEHAVAAGSGQSRFAQVGGLRFSYDLDERPGSRIKSIALIDESGIVTARVVEDGTVLGTAPAKISVVTTNNIANGSDGYALKALGDNFHYGPVHK